MLGEEFVIEEEIVVIGKLVILASCIDTGDVLDSRTVVVVVLLRVIAAMEEAVVETTVVVTVVFGDPGDIKLAEVFAILPTAVKVQLIGVLNIDAEWPSVCIGVCVSSSTHVELHPSSFDKLPSSHSSLLALKPSPQDACMSPSSHRFPEVRTPSLQTS